MSLERYKDTLSDAITALPKPTKKLPDIADLYVARSALQKALRRGEGDRAIQAAHSLLSDPQRLWRGLAIAVFEDFRSASIDLVGQVVAAASSKKLRSDLGGDLSVVYALIQQLCEVPRDRRVDETYMFAGVLDDTPLTARERRKLSPELGAMMDGTADLIRRCEKPVPRRSFKTVLAAECDAFLVEMYEAGRLSVEELGVCIQGRKTTQCLLPVLYPLTRSASRRQGTFSLTLTCPAGTYRDITGTPSYALDGYTRAGKLALERLFFTNAHLQEILKPLKNRSSKLKALAALLFVVEGGVCTQEISEPLYDELKHVSRGRWSGLPVDVIPDALDAMRAAIPELNDIREVVYGPYVP